MASGGWRIEGSIKTARRFKIGILEQTGEQMAFGCIATRRGVRDCLCI